MKQVAENDLWNRLTTGDEQALYELYLVYADVLFSFGLKYTRDKDLVKDCIHDLFVEIHKYRFKLARNVNIKFYLFSSLKRKIVSELKKTNSTVELTDSTSETDFLVIFSAEEQIIRNESRQQINRRLREELNLLPSRQKEALYLRFNSELAYEEVADLMNISVETCRTLVYRAIKQLKDKLADIPAHTILLLFFKTSK